MKLRPRRNENRVAARLSEAFVELGLSPVERIPVIGRTGPDLTINEAGLAIDAKSRQRCPKSMWQKKKGVVTRYPGGIIGVHLCDLPLLFCDVPISEDSPFRSTVVAGYLSHMAEWEEIGDNIPAVVIHRPRMHTANAIFVMYEKDLPRLRNSYKEKINVKTEIG